MSAFRAVAHGCRALAILALQLLPRVAASGLRGGPVVLLQEWPTAISLRPPTQLPDRQARLPAEDDDWLLRKQRFRQRQLAWPAAHHQALRRIIADEGFPEPGMPTADDGVAGDLFWEALCNGTSQEGLTDSIFDWRTKANLTCSPGDQLGEEITNPEEVKRNCGGSCAAVVDVGCQGSNFRLCKMGFRQQPAEDGSCLLWRVPDQRPPEGRPRPPKERAFWRALCAEGGASLKKSFRLLFRDKLCAAGLVLPGPRDEQACAEAAEDPRCSEVFDFREGKEPVCRCVPGGQECSAGPPPHQAPGCGVFIRS